MNNDNETPLFVAHGHEAAEDDQAEMRSTPPRGERGAALIEFAIILPILLSLVFGIIEFGRAYEVKVQLTGAAREGARAVALGQPTGTATAAVVAAAPGSGVTAANVTVVTACAPGVDGNATVRVSYNLPSLTPLIPSGSINLTATGVMRCGL